MSSTKHNTNKSIFVEGVQTFNQLKNESGNVESLCERSVKLENKHSKILKSYIRASLVALKAARKLMPHNIPSDDQFMEYLLNMVRDTFQDVKIELNAPRPQDKE